MTHVLELLARAVVHALRGSDTTCSAAGRPGLRGAGRISTCGQTTRPSPVTWLNTNRDLNNTYVRRLDEIEDFRCDATHLPGARNPTDPLSRRRFATAPRRRRATGPRESALQELFSRLGRDAPAQALLGNAHSHPRWEGAHSTRHSGRLRQRPGGGRTPLNNLMGLRGGTVLTPRALVCSSLSPARNSR